MNSLKLSEEAVYDARLSGKMRITSKYKLIDLFAGAGGMTLGFSKSLGHNFEPVWANDFNSFAANTYNANFNHACVVGDILPILENETTTIPKADVVIGGPPCQGFSLLNKNRHMDPRKQLWRPFMDVVERSKTKIFLMENVPQLLNSPEYQEIIEASSDMGFQVKSVVLCAADYGVPQTRYRAFILGCKFADPAQVFQPKKTHFGPKNSKKLFASKFNSYISKPLAWRSVRDAIADLPKPIGTEIRAEPPPLDIHFGRNPTPLSVKRYLAVSKEGMNRFDLEKNAPHLTPDCWKNKKTGSTDLFGRLWWDKPALTIRTEFFKPEKGRYLHPQQHRPITHREAARLQSFPDSFIFKGTKIEIAKQIGNAVPPVLAARLADSVTALLTSKV